MSTRGSNPTLMTDSIPTRTAVNCSTTYSVRLLSLIVNSSAHGVPPDSDGPVPLELPEQWLWDIIDEFIYQFQSFCVWRSKVKSKTEEELSLLADANQVWSSYSVLNVLYSLIQKSKINEHLVALQEGKSAEEIAYVHCCQKFEHDDL